MTIIYNTNKLKGFFKVPTGGTQSPSCEFSYSAASYTDADADPTPTITGNTGGVFSSTAGLVINSVTGEIDLSASTLNTYVITYTVSGKACTQSVEITASVNVNWITKWKVGAGQTITLWSPTGGTVEYSYDVDWGDGNTETSITAADKTHDYTVAGAGTYTVTITGQFGGLYMYNGSTADREALVEFVNWGTSEVNSLYRYFYKCTNMVYSATDAPDLTSLTGGGGTPNSGTWMYEMFRDCESVVTLDLSGWTNTENITNFQYCWYDCSGLQTLNLTGWDTSNISTFLSACYNAGDTTNGCAFTMPNLDLSSCTTINQIFYGTTGAVASSIDVSGWTLRAAGVTMASTFNRLKKGGAGPTLTMDLSGWSNTSGITSLGGTFGDTELTSINTTGWDTSNATTMSGTFYKSDILTHVTGLDDWSADSVTTLAYFMSDCDVYNFGAANANFGTNFMDDNAGTCTSMISVAYKVGSTTPGTAPPNVANWDTSGVTTFWNIFESCNWTGGGNLDVSGWDVSSATGNGLADVFAYSPTTVADTSAWEIPSGATSLAQFARGSEITTIDFSDVSCDLSGITTFATFGYQSKITRFILHGSSSFAACTTFSNFLPTSGYATVVTADYDSYLDRMQVTWNTALTAGVIQVGSAQYTKSILTTGTTTSTTANKLVDSGKDFSASGLNVQIGDIVFDDTGNDYAKVTAVDSATTLSLNADIMISGDAYEIDQGAAAKDKEYLIDNGWTITDANGTSN